VRRCLGSFFIASTCSDNPQVRESLSGEREKEVKQTAKKERDKDRKNGEKKGDNKKKELTCQCEVSLDVNTEIC
jgi:hypothetical protein